MPLDAGQIAAGGVGEALEVTNHHFNALTEHIGQTFQGFGGSIEVLDDLGLFEQVHRHLNPSVTQYEEEFIEGKFQQHASIMENCLAGELLPAGSGDGSIYYDSRFHGFLVMKAPPQVTYSGLVSQLTIRVNLGA